MPIVNSSTFVLRNATRTTKKERERSLSIGRYLTSLDRLYLYIHIHPATYLGSLLYLLAYLTYLLVGGTLLYLTFPLLYARTCTLPTTTYEYRKDKTRRGTRREGKGREGEQLNMNYLYLVPVCLL